MSKHKVGGYIYQALDVHAKRLGTFTGHDVHRSMKESKHARRTPTVAEIIQFVTKWGIGEKIGETEGRFSTPIFRYSGGKDNA